MLIRIHHSPDADDRFMFWPLKAGFISLPGYEFEFIEEGTPQLNRRASQGDVEVCAISAAHYPFVAESYLPMKMGASVGVGYGPVVVGTQCRNSESWPNLVTPQNGFLTPGHQTTAHFVLEYCLGVNLDFAEEVSIVPMERVFTRMAEKPSALALLIHEGRLRFQDYGKVKYADLGELWAKKTGGLSLPLGINVIHRKLGPVHGQQLSSLFQESCAYALAHKQEFVDFYAGKELSAQQLHEYLNLYANDTTLNISEQDKHSFDALIKLVTEKMNFIQREFIWV